MAKHISTNTVLLPNTPNCTGRGSTKIEVPRELVRAHASERNRQRVARYRQRQREQLELERLDEVNRRNVRLKAAGANYRWDLNDRNQMRRVIVGSTPKRS